MNLAKWAVLLSIFWLLLSGYFQALLLGFGVVSVALVVWVLYRMDAVDEEPKTLGKGFRMLHYSAWLLGQIMQSSVHVSRLVWGRGNKLEPALAQVSAEQIPEKKRALYANSITLTPGTLSVDLEDGEITVHALQRDSIDELKRGDMANKINSVWKSEP